MFIIVMCEYSKFRIESNSYLLATVDSKLTQLFEIFEYLFNSDQPGDWDAICLYFASHKQAAALTWRWTQCCAAAAAACVPTPPTPLSALSDHAHTHAAPFAFKKKTNLTYLLLRTAKTIRFDSKFRIIVQYSIRFEMKKHYSHITSLLSPCLWSFKLRACHILDGLE